MCITYTVYTFTHENECVWRDPLVLCFKTSFFTANICGQRGFLPCYWGNVLSSYPSRLQYCHYNFRSRNESLLNPAGFWQVKATQLAEISWQPDLWPTLAFSSVLYEYVLKTHKLNTKIQHQRPKPKPTPTPYFKEYSSGKLHWYT